MKEKEKKGSKKVIKLKKKDNKPKRSKKYKILVGILSFLIFIVACMLLFFLYIIITTAPKIDFDKLYKSTSSIILDKDGNEIGRLGYENIDTVTYDDLPQVLVDAIVATEDARFFQHNGFDIARFLKATFGQLTNQAGAGGASTLTMQVVKNNWTNLNAKGLSGIIRKFSDIYMSIFVVEKKFTKQEIIEFYVNMSWMGPNNTWGVEQASQLYFGKSVSDLTLPEAALIAGLFNNARIYNPFYSIENATERRDTVLNLMYRHGYITKEQRDSAQAVPVESMIVVDEESSPSSVYQSFIDTVVLEVVNDTNMNPNTTPMKITTTMESRVQEALSTIDTSSSIKFPDEKVETAVAVTNPQDGSLIATYGGRNYNRTNGKSLQNRATDPRSKFQPGSTIKPIMDYGPYIEFNNGSPYTIFFDEPMTYSTGGALKNADGAYMGQISMRTALSKSRNIPAVQAFQQVDKDKIADFVHALGIDYGDVLHESYAIGAFEYGVNPLAMAAAYAAFANGGYYIEPYSYTKIEFIDTGEVIEKKGQKERVMSEETAYMITSILMTAFQNKVGANFTIAGSDLASKTGTSTWGSAATSKVGVNPAASKDNWSITYSPDYVISLVYGYDKLEKDYYTMPVPAANMTKKLMTAIGPKIYKKNSKFTKPSGVVSVEVESDTIPVMLPSANTPANKRTTELFREGTEPTEVSKRYETLENPASVTSNVSNNSVTINWQAISTPWAIDEVSQQEYFNNLKNIFGDNKWVENIITKYYDNRIKENSTQLGSLIYDIYENGTLLGSTTNTSYTINNVSQGSHTYVVKASYTLFKAASSSGISVTTNVGNQISEPEEENKNEIGTITLADGDLLCIVINSSYEPKGISKITDINGNDITKSVSITKKIKNGSYEVSKIDTSKEGTFRIEYNVTYKGESKIKTQTVNIRNTCSSPN